MKKIILCSTQRSGSTMIVEDMRNSGVLGNPEEYFIRWQQFDESVDTENEIESLFQQGTSSNIFSVKIMADQVKKVNISLRRSTQYSDIYSLFNDASWVYIKRNNTVKQAISRYIASVTKVNHAIEEETSHHFAGNLLKGNYTDYNKDVPYNFNTIFQEYCAVRKENLFWEEFFSKHGIKPLKLEYETYSKHDDYRHIQQIADYANINNPPRIIERKLKKLSNETNKKFVELFRDEIFDMFN